MEQHKPVLLRETIDYLYSRANGIYIDGTLGRGGHSELLLEKLQEDGMIIGIDRDKDAVKAARRRFSDNDRIEIIHDNFINIPRILDKLQIDRVDGMLFDLGVSSPQFDRAERGFSYSKNGPLDMRMNKNQTTTAADIVNNYTEEELTAIINNYGEERWASRIAKFIVDYRERNRIEETGQLVEIIKNAIPAGARRKGGHPARRTFQALRIATNDELNQLEKMINRVVGRLKEGGRICIISFHSLEDRIVKHTYRELAKDCICPPDFPICNCDHEAELKLITSGPIRPDQEEIDDNPRARSAKLRVAEKIQV